MGATFKKTWHPKNSTGDNSRVEMMNWYCAKSESASGTPCKAFALREQLNTPSQTPEEKQAIYAKIRELGPMPIVEMQLDCQLWERVVQAPGFDEGAHRSLR